jgi:5-methylcytosine-specific restriction endonuclease McrA
MSARRRHRAHLKRASVSDITSEQEMAMRKKAKNCPLCGVRMTDQPYLPSSKHLDHIVPINQGGTHTHGNTRIICCSCNVRRPHDGSDYDGQLTLWAQSPGVQERAPRKGGFRNTTTCRKGLHPWPESAVVLWGHKQCGPCVEASRGEGYISRIGTRRKGVRGADARLEMGRRIQEMRKQGMPFRAIARELGYSDSRSVRDLLAMVVTAGDESADQANYPKQSA